MNPRMTPSHANPSRSNTFRMAVLSTAVPACTRTTAACSNSHPVSSAAAVDPVPRPRSAGSKIAMPSWATPAGRFQARPWPPGSRPPGGRWPRCPGPAGPSATGRSARSAARTALAAGGPCGCARSSRWRLPWHSASRSSARSGRRATWLASSRSIASTLPWPRLLRRRANEASGHPRLASPCTPGEAAAARTAGRSSSPAVPSTCPKQRFTAVTGGQRWSAVWAGELCRRPLTASPTVLPKLAVRVRFPSPAPPGIPGHRSALHHGRRGGSSGPPGSMRQGLRRCRDDRRRAGPAASLTSLVLR